MNMNKLKKFVKEHKVLEVIGTQDIFDVYDMFGAETIEKSNELVRDIVEKES